MDKKQKYISYLLITIGIVILSILGGILFLSPKTSSPKQSETKVNLSSQSSTFKLSTENKTQPIFKEISFDPFKAKGGINQKLIVALEDKALISAIYAQAQDEIGNLRVNFLPVKKEGNISYWQGKWKIRMTEKKEYPMVFYAEDSQGGKNQITLFWKAEKGGSLNKQSLIDKIKYNLGTIEKKWKSKNAVAGYINMTDCSSKDNFPHAKGATIKSNIALFSSDFPVTGIDGGSLTIDSGKTLQLNSGITFVFNPGQHISPIGNIALADGAQIVKGYLWMKDADNDGCGSCDNPSADVTYASSPASPGSGWKRVKDIAYYPDSDDSNAGDAPGCITCQCTSGLCCDGCNYYDSSHACSTGTDYDYQCSGTGCGADAQRRQRSKTQYCSGTSASCDGSISYGSWSSWKLLHNCTSDEKCHTDNSTYANCQSDSSCVTCDWQWQEEYLCPWAGQTYYRADGDYCLKGCGVKPPTIHCNSSSDAGKIYYSVSGWHPRWTLRYCAVWCQDAQGGPNYSDPDCYSGYLDKYKCVCQ